MQTTQPAISSRRYRPQWVPLVFCAFGVVLCMVLGAWQVQRLQWKEGILAHIASAQQMPPLHEVKGAQDLYRNAQVAGHWVCDGAVYRFSGNTVYGKGYKLLRLLELKDGTRVMVDTGFTTQAPPHSPPAGTAAMCKKPAASQRNATVQGMIRGPLYKRWLTPETPPSGTLWLYEDVPAMAAAMGVSDKKLLPDVILEVTGIAEPNVFPVPGDGKVVLRNDHLGYAITWFALALVSAGMGFVFIRAQTKKAGAKAAA